jgi:hypothetical protein
MAAEELHQGRPVGADAGVTQGPLVGVHVRGGLRADRGEQAESPEAEAAGAAHGAFLVQAERMPDNSAVDSALPRPPATNLAGRWRKRGIERHRSMST